MNGTGSNWDKYLVSQENILFVCSSYNTNKINVFMREKES